MRTPKPILPNISTSVINIDEIKKGEEIAEHYYEALERKRNEHALRAGTTKKVTNAFLIINFLMLLFVAVIYAVDTFFFYKGIPHSSIIDAKVLMTLIGATTVQLGILMIGIGAWLFPRGKNSSS
jgi:uncharacterized membrane protein YidH (DUF202 family)